MEDIIPMTAAQLAARDRAHEHLRREYPDQYVGYIDVWNGDTLTRTVVAASPTPGGFRELLDALPEEVARPLRVTRVSALDAPLFASRLLFDAPV